MNVLVVNAGSSSLKYQLLEADTRHVMVRGACERIGSSDSFLVIAAEGEEKRHLKMPIPNHRTAITFVLGMLFSADLGDGNEGLKVDAIGHRVVHGGAYFDQSVVVTDDVINKIEEIAPLAPLHNYAAATVIESCREIIPDVPNIVAFDTAYHMTIPEVAYRYPLPRQICDENKIRKYGAHGISHCYAAKVVEERNGSTGRLINAHLGNGSSICAILDGKSIDTTMGFTPLDGLMMGTRSGSIDPAIVTYLIEKVGMSAREVDTLLNKQSGLLGISELTNDVRTLSEAAAEGNEFCEMALDMFAYSARKHIGTMWGILGGCDTLVFTAGVGQNSAEIRAKVTGPLKGMGIEIDPKLNEIFSDDVRVISTPESKVEVLVVPADEEYMIALDVKKVFESGAF